MVKFRFALVVVLVILPMALKPSLAESPSNKFKIGVNIPLSGDLESTPKISATI